LIGKEDEGGWDPRLRTVEIKQKGSISKIGGIAEPRDTERALRKARRGDKAGGPVLSLPGQEVVSDS